METEEILSVLDHEAFAAKRIPDMGYDVKEFQVFHWKLQDWKKLEAKLTSPEFDCGGYKWRILLFPFSISRTPPSDTISVYLDCTGPKGIEADWHACAQFALAISNPHDPTIYTVCHARHRFIAEEPDWGFKRFSQLPKLTQPKPGRNRPVIEEDSAVVSVYVRVLEDPTGVLWHSFFNYDSKKETGYVGLKNQGATGYMNTVLQSLFCTDYFRKAVYRIPTENHNPTESVPLALQRLFYNLQISDQPVVTTELTNSFGWRSIDSFVQHDVREFNTVLQDKLGSLMKGTPAEDTISKLFVGKMKSFINVNHEESRIQEFNDIELNVKGLKTLHESFRDYVAVEMLDGEHQYQAREFGLQDARKGIVFQSLPPVLHLQLRRHEYDAQRDIMVKINDRFEFPFEIDLAEFLEETTDRTKPWKYKLHGVFAHSGDRHGGQYFAFIKPDQHTRWLKFDDERVTPVTDREVLEENYGGEPLNTISPQTQSNQVRVTNKSTTARTLVYIRESETDEVLAPLVEEDIPPHLKRRLDEERVQMEAKKKEIEEQRLNLTAKVVTDETFSRHEGFDLAFFDERNSLFSNLAAFRVPKQETYNVFKSRVAQHFNYPESQIRLWVSVNRQNGTVRPDALIPENEPSLTVEVIRDTAVRQSDLWLYLDVLPDPSKGIPSNNTGEMMIFLKHFDTTKQSLLGVGKTFMERANKVSDLIPIINERMRWESGTSLRFYEEIKPGMIEPMKLEHTFGHIDLQDGDVVCFQVNISDQEARNLESQGLCSDPPQFYKLLQNRATEQRPVQNH